MASLLEELQSKSNNMNRNNEKINDNDNQNNNYKDNHNENENDNDIDIDIDKTSKKRIGRANRSRTKHQNIIPIELDDMSIFLRTKDEILTLEDVQFVTNQLGYIPYNIIQIGAYSSSSKKPLVAILYPLLLNDLKGNYIKEEGYKPFPTTMWITCPKLHSRISKLEDQGWINVIQEKIKDEKNKEYLEIMHNAHDLYSKYRWSLLSTEDIELIETKGWTPKLRDVGIAGIRSFEGVKCLHCHYAHYLCKPEHNNIIGKWVEELLKTIP